jgi:predicted nucleotidyltransferase component of viral defense system
MSLFDKLVEEALKNRQDLAQLRVVVEKELLHHDILRVLSSTGMLAQLIFIGGTCLRACYGSNRLSEDLDFTGGADFSRERLKAMSQILVDSLKTKYGLQVEVSDPARDEGKVSTWKLKVQTRPDRINDMPAQRINIDVCAIPSYQVRPMMLLNPYGVEMGTGGLILQVESREEIFSDKLVAFALRPNRIKYRDLWDIIWLNQQGIKPQISLISAKLKDHHCEMQHFLQQLDERQHMMQADPKLAIEFRKEMRRFLPVELVTKTSDQPDFWKFLIGLMDDLCAQIRQYLNGEKSRSGFQM